MTNDAPQKLNTLQAWEADLAPQVRQIELLGEITLSLAETQQLGGQLGRFIAARHHRGVLETREAINKTCPCAFAVLLVAQGVHDSNAENGFWPDLDHVLGQKLNTNWHRQFGLLFEEILQINNLSLFPDAGGYRYVSLILLHGGIPNYSLPDYFYHLLRPAVTQTDLAGLPPSDLIDEWLHHGSGRYFIDKPVLRFLEFGGQVAVDFVERSLELAHEYLERGLVPAAEEVGLPHRVIEGFHHWLTENQDFGRSEISRRKRTGLRLRRPEIRLDPWGEGISLDLMPQQIPAKESQARLDWEIKLDGELETTLPLRLQRLGYNLQTPFETLVLERAIASCEVALLFDNQARRTWSFDLDSPLLVFDPANHTLLRWKNSLPARVLWLLYPHDADLEISGSGHKADEFPPLPWGWAGLKGEEWDLSQTSRLTLHRDEQPLFTVPVRADDMAQRPHLVEGTRHQTFTLIKTPLYLGSPPVLRIPLVGRSNPDEELNRWRLTLHNAWPAVPAQNLRRVPLSELSHQLTHQENYVDLRLAGPTLLGATPMGSYTIRMRGPLGRDAELPLRLMPHLSLSGHEPLYLPDPNAGPLDIELLVETQPGIELEAQADDTPCRVQLMEQQDERWLYQVIVPPKLTEARLTAVMAQPDSESVRVPLHVPLRRLRWTLTGDTARVDSQRLNWSGRIIKQSLDALEQTDAPVLFVDLGPSGEVDASAQATLGLSLVDLEGQELQQMYLTRPLRDPDSVVWRFELSAFLDTIRHNPSPVLRFSLKYQGDEGLVDLPVLNITRSMQVEQAQVTVQETGPATTVNVNWHEPARLRHRRVRFWPIWQPWRPYREEEIPDEAAGEFNFRIMGPDFLVGKYLLEFLVVDPWMASTPPAIRPPTSGPNLAVLELTLPEMRLEQIERGIQQAGPSFSLFLEHAFVEADRRQPEAVLADLYACYKWFDQATLPQILTMVDLAQTVDDDRLLTLLRLKMSKSERLKQLIREHQLNRLSQVHLDAYRDQILYRTGLWPLDTCVTLLDFPYEPVQIFALMNLIQRGDPTGGNVILERLKNHHMSDIDGVDLFEINLDFAANFLANRLDEPSVKRLFGRLTERYPDRDWPVLLVKIGCFVQCQAGWGQINKIEHLDTAEAVDYYIKGETDFRLNVTLRPNHDCVPVTVEALTDRQRLLFKPELKLYRCNQSKKCAFISPDQDLLYNGHNRLAHEGVRTKFNLATSPVTSIKPLEYRLRAPQDILE